MGAMIIIIFVVGVAVGSALLNLFRDEYLPREQYSLTSRPPVQPGQDEAWA